MNEWFRLNKVPSTFDGNSTIEDLKAHLDRGYPVIVHGYFTSFGHIIVLKGYNDSGFIAHDPYGVFPYKDWRSGKDVTYSYQFIKDKCDIDGIWAHFPYKGD